MNSRRTFLSFALMLFGLAAVFGSQTAVAQTTDPSPPHGGKVVGVWGFPSAGVPGKAQGVLFENGAARFLFKADLFPGSPGGGTTPDGAIKGRLFMLSSDGTAHFFALVHGHWATGPNGRGVFRTKILRPNAGGEWKVIGAMNGHFDDPSPGTPGRFKGHWGIHL